MHFLLSIAQDLICVWINGMEVDIGSGGANTTTGSIRELWHGRQEFVNLNDQASLILEHLGQVGALRGQSHWSHVRNRQDNAVITIQQVDLETVLKME